MPVSELFENESPPRPACELDRIVYQIHQDLAESQRITREPRQTEAAESRVVVRTER
jgi:hypothetical protein